jgi:hypothetical protein
MWPHERPEAHFTSHRLLLEEKLPILLEAAWMMECVWQWHLCAIL